MGTHEVKTKAEISKMKLEISIGFLYWLGETHNLRGLKNSNIESYPNLLDKLLKEYKEKYPNGLTGWN